MTRYVQLTSDGTVVVTVFGGPQSETFDKPGYAEVQDDDPRYAAWVAERATMSGLHALEAQQTPRRVREAALGTDGGWLKALDAKIAALRAGIKMTVLGLLLLGLIIGGATAAQLVNLTANLVDYVSPAGSDATGTGTAANPFATPTGAHLYALANYNMAGEFTITHQLAAGTYATQPSGPYGTLIGGRVTGQGGDFLEIFSGAGAALTTLTGGSGGGYALGVVGDASIAVNNLTVAQPGFANDTVSVGNARISFGSGIIFGNNQNPNNDLTCVGGSSQIQFQNSYSVSKTVISYQASFTAGSTTLYLPGTTGIVVGMGVLGSGSAPYMMVTAVNPTTGVVTVSVPVTATGSASWLYFVLGGQAHMDIANGCSVLYATNCGQQPFSVSMGWAWYYDSFIHVAEGATADLGANFSGNVGAYKYSVHTNGILNACGKVPGMGATLLPGAFGAGPVDTGGQVD